MVENILVEQLKNQRFVMCNGDKRATEKEWTTKANYSFNEMVEKNPQIYGVLCGHNNLVVLDCDSKEIQEKLMKVPQMMNTFIVKTAGKQLYHFYFYVQNGEPKTLRINNTDGERIMDLQGKGTYVVGPNSKMFNGKIYEIVNPTEIQTIDYKFLLEIINDCGSNVEMTTVDEKIERDYTPIEFDPVCKMIKQKIRIKDILPPDAQDRNPTMCPLGHESVGGKCFSYTDNVWYCFHCNKTGSIFQLYQQMHDVDFQTAKNVLLSKAGLENNFRIKVLEYYKDPKTRNKAVELLANEFIKLNKVYTIRSDKELEMWIYKDGIYVQHARTYLYEFCNEIFGPLYRVTFANEVCNKICSLTYIEKEFFFSNETTELVAIQNGLLNINTREIIDFNPKYRFFSKLPVFYQPKVKPDAIMRFLKDILRDEKDLNSIQELFGYLLYREYRFEKAWMFIGNGRNGKGKLLGLMESFLGKNNVCNVTLQQLVDDKWATQRLLHKMANLSGDLSDKELSNTGIFKNLTGRDLMTADRKFLSEVNFRNYAKMIFAANTLPQTTDNSDGFWDRWIIIDFMYKFVDKPTEPHHKKIDTAILDKIITERELSGLLNWALDGLDRLLKQKCFTNNTSTNEIRKTWFRKSSSFSAFIEDMIEKDFAPDSYITASALSSAYSRYCMQHELTPETAQKITKHMNRFGSQKSRKKIEGDYEYIWINAKFKADEEEMVIEG